MSGAAPLPDELDRRWALPELRTALAGPEAGLAVECVAQIDSTNTELMRRLRAGRVQDTLLVAESQSAGRGRQGRTWLDDGPAADGGLPAALMFSISLALAPSQWSGLSLAVGVTVAASLHPDVRLKWPNDLWWDDRKLGGILIETAHRPESRHVVVGVGLNVRRPAFEGVSVAPAWLQERMPSLEAPQLLARVAPALLAALRRFEREGFAPFRSEFERRDLLRGRQVQLSDGTEGLCEGVDADGGLRLQTAKGPRTVISQEVSVRPAPAAHRAELPGATRHGNGHPTPGGA